jgi:hypothetical protein
LQQSPAKSAIQNQIGLCRPLQHIVSDKDTIDLRPISGTDSQKNSRLFFVTVTAF